MTLNQVMSLVILIVMILLSMCFSLCETSYSSLNAIRLKKMAKDGDKKAKKALQAHRNLTAATTSILIGNTIANIVATSLAAILFSELFGAFGLMLSTVGLTLIILIGCEIVPKTVAKSKPEAIARTMSTFMLILIAIFKPVSMIVVNAQTKWETKHGIKQITATEEELLEIVSTIEREGILVQDERELIESVIAFDDTQVKDVMMPKDQVIWIDSLITFDELKQIILEHKFTRMPITSKATNQVVGILHIQDVLDSILLDEPVNILEVMDPVIYVDKLKRLPQALALMQKHRSHMLVVKEDSSTNDFIGVVTLEDVVEELVGEIYDEFDILPSQVVEYGHYTFEVDGGVNCDYFFETYIDDYRLPFALSKTIAAWVKELVNGNIEVGKTVVFEHFEIKILEVKDNEVLKVRIVETTPEEEGL